MIKDCISFPTNSRQLLSYNPYSFTLTQNSELGCGSDAAWEKLSSEESIWLIGMTSKHLRVFILNMGSTNFLFFFFFSGWHWSRLRLYVQECFDADWLKRKTHTRPSLSKQQRIQWQVIMLPFALSSGQHKGTSLICSLSRPENRQFIQSSAIYFMLSNISLEQKLH